MIKSSTKLTIDIYSVALAIKSPYVSMLSIPLHKLRGHKSKSPPCKKWGTNRNPQADRLASNILHDSEHCVNGISAILRTLRLKTE